MATPRRAATEGCRLARLGIVSPLGAGVEAVRESLFAGEPGAIERHVALISGRETCFASVRAELAALDGRLAHFDSRNSRLVLAAFRQLEDDVSRVVEECGAHRLATVMGSSTSGIASGENALLHHAESGELPASYRYEQQEIGSVSAALAACAGADGPAYTVSTACSSSAKVFACGRSLLESGVADAVLVGGADSRCRLTLEGFDALQLVAEDVCAPFSRDRTGITIGEGVALFLMTRERGGVQLLGVGESSDAWHMSTPRPDGSGAEDAMRRALSDAGRRPADIAYVNLHGTGTRQNDAMEAAAVARVFPAGMPCSSTKALVGHGLGAAGAMEAAFCWLALAEDGESVRLPPHVGDGEPDDQIAALRLVGRGERVTLGERSAFLSSSFAFGGSNCALVLGRDES